MEIILIIVAYLIPTWIALALRANVSKVATVNILLGWTIVGWFVALSLTSSVTTSAEERLRRDLDILYQRGCPIKDGSGDFVTGPLCALKNKNNLADPESWNVWPHPHPDKDNTCQCPDHQAIRRVAAQEHRKVHS